MGRERGDVRGSSYHTLEYDTAVIYNHYESPVVVIFFPQMQCT